KFWIVEVQSNTRFECLINSLSTVSGEEEGSLVVIQQSQEDTNDSRTFQVRSFTLRQEDVSLVKEENRIPLLGSCKDALEVGFNFLDRSSNLAHLHGVEWTFLIL